MTQTVYKGPGKKGLRKLSYKHRFYLELPSYTGNKHFRSFVFEDKDLRTHLTIASRDR